MTSLAVSRPFECAPHATRSFAMALTLSLNLAIVLFALLPSTPHTIHAPPPQSLLAVLQPPAPPPTPAVPTLQVVKPVAVPSIHVAPARPVPIAIPVPQAIAPVQTPTGTSVTGAVAAVADSSATIAYETATPPAYPVQALRTGIQGTVLLRVLVDPSGKPAQVLVEHSSGSRMLDDAARRHVLAAWRFHPAIRNGRAIEAWAVVPVRFNLDQG